MGFEPTTTSTCCDVSTVLCQLSYEANWELIIYTAVFEKGCPTKPYATMPKGIVGSKGLRYLIEALGVSAT